VALDQKAVHRKVARPDLLERIGEDRCIDSLRFRR